MTETLEIHTESPQTTPKAPQSDQTLNARARFFPAWSMHIGTSRDSAPLYRVVCANRDDLALAQAVKPEFIEAEYFLCD